VSVAQGHQGDSLSESVVVEDLAPRPSGRFKTPFGDAREHPVILHAGSVRDWRSGRAVPRDGGVRSRHLLGDDPERAESSGSRPIGGLWARRPVARIIRFSCVLSSRLGWGVGGVEVAVDLAGEVVTWPLLVGPGDLGV